MFFRRHGRELRVTAILGEQTARTSQGAREGGLFALFGDSTVQCYPMSEEESFILAIASSPGDHVQRLVYADWLDDRSDPRGPYLRAEAEWAVGRRQVGWVPPATEPERQAVLTLRRQAAGSDPVWVARVSRPPIGVCCEHVIVEPGLHPASEEAVRAYEEEAEITLPAQYQALLLNHDGGRVYPDTFPDGGVMGFHSFRPLAELERHDLPTLVAFREGFEDLVDAEESDPEPDARLLWIAGEECSLQLQIEGRRGGRIRSLDGYDAMHCPAVADSLGELLARLTSPDPAWVRLAIAGQTEDLLRILEGGLGINAQSGYWSPLYAASDWGRVDTVRALLARGARVAPAYQTYHGYSQYPEIRQLLDEAAAAKRL
jgi:uncharacterized protein (TIGR02996 family)